MSAPESGDDHQRRVQTAPVGLEELLAMAAVDTEFAAALSEDRDRAVSVSGVELTPTERDILNAVDDATLARRVGTVGRGIPEQDRRQFINLSAAAMLALVGGGVVASTGCPATGAWPDRPVPPPARGTGARPDRPDAGQPPSQKPTAVHPDRPEKSTPDRRTTTGARPDRPQSE